MTKKVCALCGRRGKQVVARESNTGAAKEGGRRCIFRVKCRKGKAS